MIPVEIAKGIYDVGVTDWNIRDFHGYKTSRGTTYNAYLVLGEDPILIDTVKAPFYEEMMARIASVIAPEKIRYIISNHAEMDHSGGLPRAIADIKPEKIFASKMGVKALKAHFHLDMDITPLDNTQCLEVGDLKFTFLETRMLHWPDSMHVPCGTGCGGRHIDHRGFCHGQCLVDPAPPASQFHGHGLSRDQASGLGYRDHVLHPRHQSGNPRQEGRQAARGARRHDPLRECDVRL